MGAVTQGTRLYKGLLSGDNFLWMIQKRHGAYGTPNGTDWYATTPNGIFGTLHGHHVIEHNDGTITVAPSILVHGWTEEQQWHGFLERGVWREC